MLSVIPA